LFKFGGAPSPNRVRFLNLFIYDNVRYSAKYIILFIVSTSFYMLLIGSSDVVTVFRPLFYVIKKT